MTDSRTRSYRKRKRAKAEEETRRNIVDAAVELHGTVGPASTTISEIARIAGVSRMTVYNHFPSDAELFGACSSQWAAHNPFPDPAAWSEDDPSWRLESALVELYGWYDDNHVMLGNVLRDAPAVPALAEVMGGMWQPWTESVFDALSRGWESSDPDALQAALRVAVDFHCWRALHDSGLDTLRAAAVMTRMVSALDR